MTGASILIIGALLIAVNSINGNNNNNINGDGDGAANRGRCPAGFWRGDRRLSPSVPAQCLACPAGLDCATMRPCSASEDGGVEDEELISLEGGGRCCPRSLVCPQGRVVDSTNCLCAPLECADASHVLFFADAARQLACSPPSEHPSLRACALMAAGRLSPCGVGQALDPHSCACLAVRDCGSADTAAALPQEGGPRRGRSDEASAMERSSRAMSSNASEHSAAFTTAGESAGSDAITTNSDSSSSKGSDEAQRKDNLRGVLWRTGKGNFRCILGA